MKITVETCCGIAFANGDEEPAKGRQGRVFDMPQCAIRHGRNVIRSSGSAGRPRRWRATNRDSFQFNASEISVTAHPCGR